MGFDLAAAPFEQFALGAEFGELGVEGLHPLARVADVGVAQVVPGDPFEADQSFAAFGHGGRVVLDDAVAEPVGGADRLLAVPVDQGAVAPRS